MRKHTYRYFIKHGDEPEQEVDRAEWLRVERAAGFNAPAGKEATAGFSAWIAGKRVSGKMRLEDQ